MKVLLVDDHTLIRDALRGVLNELTSDATVLEAPDWRQAMRAIEALLMASARQGTRNSSAAMSACAKPAGRSVVQDEKVQSIMPIAPDVPNRCAERMGRAGLQKAYCILACRPAIW